MRVQQAKTKTDLQSDVKEIENSENIENGENSENGENGENKLVSYAIWPASGRMRKGFTRVSILSEETEGLLLPADNRENSVNFHENNGDGNNGNNGNDGNKGNSGNDGNDGNSGSTVNSSPTHVFEVIINDGAAYLEEKNIIFCDDEKDYARGRRIIDFSSGWKHNIVVLETPPKKRKERVSVSSSSL